MKKFLLALTLGLLANGSNAQDDPKPSDYALKLEKAVKENNVAMAKTLIAQPQFSPLLMGATSRGPRTIFEIAALENRPTIANLMFASPRFKIAKWTVPVTSLALERAGQYPAFNPLVKQLAKLPHWDLNTPQTPDNDRLLITAASVDNVDLVKFLVAQPKVNLTAKDNEGGTALHFAEIKSLPVLLKTGKFDINARGGAGQTPLHQAVFNGSAARVKLLLAQPKINPNLKDNDGDTPLSIALTRNAEIAGILMKNPKVKATKAQRAQYQFILKNGVESEGGRG